MNLLFKRCFSKKQIDVSFSCVCRSTDNKFCHSIVKVDSVMTKLIINNRRDA